MPGSRRRGAANAVDTELAGEVAIYVELRRDLGLSGAHTVRLVQGADRACVSAPASREQHWPIPVGPSAALAFRPSHDADAHAAPAGVGAFHAPIVVRGDRLDREEAPSFGGHPADLPRAARASFAVRDVRDVSRGERDRKHRAEQHEPEGSREDGARTTNGTESPARDRAGERTRKNGNEKPGEPREKRGERAHEILTD